MADSNSMPLKACTVCKVSKPISAFHAHRQKKDGLNSWCKACESIKQAEYKERKPDWKAHKKAYDAARVARLADYLRAQAAARYRITREKKIAAAASWAAANPEKCRAIKGNYKHRRRAVESVGASYSEVERWKAAQPQVCFWCKATDCKLVLDHYFPLSRGGAHEISNFVLACRSCNARKSAKPPEQFAAENGTPMDRLFP